MNVVAIGGGTGLATLLRGLKLHVAEPGRPARSEPQISRLTALVTVTDEGGSSGKLRREFGIPPPGDIRSCLVALSDDEQLFTRLFNYRFADGRGLAGHSFGNLFLAALTGLTHDFAKAVRVSSEVLAVRGEIFPSTLSDVRLKARLRDGRLVNGERRISKTHVPIQRLHIVPSQCQPLPEAVAAIRAADLITIGPGSLYTSLIPNLLVRGIRDEVMRSKALKVYVANLMTQPGETKGYTAADHVRALHQHAGGRAFERVILNTGQLPRAMLRRYAAERAAPVENDLEAVRALGVDPVLADLLAAHHVARHDPQKLAKLLLSHAVRQRRELPAAGKGR